MRSLLTIQVVLVGILIIGLIFAHTFEYHSTEGIKKPSESSKTKFKSEGKKPSESSKTKFKSEGKKPSESESSKKNIKQPTCHGQGSCIEESDLANTGINVKKSDRKGDEVDINEIDVGKIDVGKIDIDDTELDDIDIDIDDIDIDIDDIDDIDIDIDDIDDIDIDIDDIDDIDIDIDYYYDDDDDDDDDDDNTDDQVDESAVNEGPSTTDAYTSLINESAITSELEMIKQGKFKLEIISSGSIINPINDSAFALQGSGIGNSTVNWINDGTPDQVLAFVGVNNSKMVKIPNGYNTYLAQDEVILGKNDFLVLTFVPELQKWLQVGFEESSS